MPQVARPEILNCATSYYANKQYTANTQSSTTTYYYANRPHVQARRRSARPSQRPRSCGTSRYHMHIYIYIYICVYIYTYTYTYNAYTYTYAYTRGKQDRAGGEAVQGSADDTAAHSFHHSNLAKPDADPVTCSDWCCQPKANLVFVCLFVCDADPGHHLVIKSLVNISLRRAMRPSKTGACFSQAPTYV